LAANRVAQDLEIAGDVLLVAERRAGQDAGRVVDRTDEGQPRPARLEPVVAAAVELQEEAGLGHPVTPAAMARWPAVPRARPAGCPQDPPDGRPAHDQALVGEEVDEVAVIGAGEPTAGQLKDPRPVRVAEPTGRWSAPIAVDEAGRPVRQEAAFEPPDRPLRQPEQGHCLGHRHRARHDPGQDHRPPLFVDRHRDLPHDGETDKVIEQLGLTKSRSNDTAVSRS
jgi:hypothetical protein